MSQLSPVQPPFDWQFDGSLTESKLNIRLSVEITGPVDDATKAMIQVMLKTYYSTIIEAKNAIRRRLIAIVETMPSNVKATIV